MVCDLSLTCNLLATFGNLFLKPSLSLTLSNIDGVSASKRSRVDPFSSLDQHDPQKNA